MLIKVTKKNTENKLENVWVIIPAHNEEKNIGNVIDKCKKYTNNIVVVDDGSLDNTSMIAEKKGVVLIKHLVNLGKGATLKTGCFYAYRNKANIIVLLDGDGQHNPDLIPTFLKKLKDSDIVLSYRRFNKKMPVIFRVGNNFINFIIKLFFNIKVKDSQCGYRVFWAKNFKKIRWRAHDYSMESEMFANIRKSKLRYKQVPIETLYKDDYKGTTVLDGIKIVYYIMKWWVVKW